MYSCLYQYNTKWQDTDIWRKIHYFQIRYQLSTWIECIVSDILQPSSQKFYMLTILFLCEKFVEIHSIWSAHKNLYGWSLNMLFWVWIYIKVKWEIKKYSLKQMKLVNHLHQLGLSTQEMNKYFVLIINNSEFGAHFILEFNLCSDQKSGN